MSAFRLSDALSQLCEKQIIVSIYLQNGIKLMGYILGIDQQTILLKNNSKHPLSQLIYQHAIASIVPMQT